MSDVDALFDERAARAGLTVAGDLKRPLLVYYDLLVRWNRKINLTALTDPAAAIDRLLLEPVSAAAHLPSSTPMADLGSGGGSPAIPLALALKAPRLLMVESRSRKAAFLREAGREVGLTAIVEAMRFEELAAAHTQDACAGLVTMRAVSPDRTSLSLAIQLSKTAGTVAIFTSRDELIEAPPGLQQRSTWNIRPSGMLITFHVEHP
jgi:16S rRNA (guanine527-N7)-methyltransferase